MLTCRVSGIFLVLIVQSQMSFAQKSAVEKRLARWSSGFERFNESCAFCLGIDARGNGAAAGLLSTQPAGLTQLSKRNDNIFPLEYVYLTLDGRNLSESYMRAKIFEIIMLLNSTQGKFFGAEKRALNNVQ